MRHVVLPQAIRRVIPPLLNDFIGLQKDTALVGLLGLVEVARAAENYASETFNFAGYTMAALLFIAVTIPLARGDGLAHRARPAADAGLGRMSAPSDPVLRLEGVRKSYGDIEVLRGIDLDVAAHEVVCLIGASGCGKSTLLKCSNLIEPVTDGQIFFEGEEITALDSDLDAIRRRIGIVFQAFNLFPHMTVLANVTLAPRKVLKLSEADARDRAMELLVRFGLGDKAGEYPDRLSGGQQQRAAIVRALAMQPQLMLLDEITSALDPELVGEVLTVVRELAGSGLTMIISTHEMGFARQIADRVCFMSEGVILEQGPPDRIFTAPEQERTEAFLKRVIEAGRAADFAAPAP